MMLIFVTKILWWREVNPRPLWNCRPSTCKFWGEKNLVIGCLITKFTKTRKIHVQFQSFLIYQNQNETNIINHDRESNLTSLDKTSMTSIPHKAWTIINNETDYKWMYSTVTRQDGKKWPSGYMQALTASYEYHAHFMKQLQYNAGLKTSTIHTKGKET